MITVDGIELPFRSLPKRERKEIMIIGIDPGPEKSAYVVWDGQTILGKDNLPNSELLNFIRGRDTILAIEGVQNFGKVVGKDVFRTCIMIGRILEAANISTEKQNQHMIYRPSIKAYLCGNVRAKDKDIRHELIKRLGKETTAGCAEHLWSALAVAYVAFEIRSEATNIEKRKISYELTP